MIKYKIGDLIQAAKCGEVNVIAHCCNCFNTMGAGIAPQIKSNFPYAWEADQETSRGDPKKLGTISVGIAEEQDFAEDFAPDVFNLYGQFGFNKRNSGGRDLDYNAIFDALSAMVSQLEEWEADKSLTQIGLPLIGCGLAGGDWDIVELMIKKTLCKAGFNVTVYIRNEKEIPSAAAMQFLVESQEELDLINKD